MQMLAFLKEVSICLETRLTVNRVENGSLVNIYLVKKKKKKYHI